MPKRFSIESPLVSELRALQRDVAAAISGPIDGRLSIYRNTAMRGSIEALGANYPVVAQLLGPEMFAAAATDHVEAHPPKSPVLALYGAAFPDWIATQPWVADLPYLVEVARCERLHLKSLFAVDEPALGLDALKGVDDWQTLRLAIHPGANFDWMTTPAMSIWLAHQEEVPLQLDLDWQAEGALFTRAGLVVTGTVIDSATHRFLSGIRLGEPVGDAAIAAASLYPGVDIGALFASLVNAGAFAALTP